MQRLTQKQMAEQLQGQARRSLGGGAKTDRRRQPGLRKHNSINSTRATISSSAASSSTRSCLAQTFSVKNQVPESLRLVQHCRQYGHTAPMAGEILIKRALTPPKRRFTHRWWHFRPTPSRLSNMSMI